MADYLVQEDGFKINLEDGTGALLLEPSFDARLSQLPVEVVTQGVADARLSQLPVEVVVQGESDARLSQMPVEVIHRNLHETFTIVIWE